VLLLNDKRTSPYDLFRYRVIVVSYSFVAAELRRMDQFIEDVANYKTEKSSKEPVRPTVALLSGIFAIPGCKDLGKYLVLDEIRSIKSTRILAALEKLRSYCDTCVLMTEVPPAGDVDRCFRAPRPQEGGYLGQGPRRGGEVLVGAIQFSQGRR